MWRCVRIVLVTQATLLAACGPSASPTILPETHADAATTVRDDRRPPITVIRRQGDEAAVAVALAHDVGPNWNRGLGRALAHEMSRVGLVPRISLFTRGLVASVPVGAQQTNLARDVRSAVLAAAKSARPEASTPALDPCDPLPTFSGESIDLGRQNVSLALVGDATTVDALAESFSATDPWPDGDVPAWNLPSRDVYVSARAPLNSLSLALLVPDSARLFAARDALVASELLAHVAREYPPGFSLDGIAASQLAAGGCLSLTFSASNAVRTDEATHLLLSARALAEDELHQAAEADRLVPALLARRSREAAELAAWQGLSVTTDSTDLQVAVVRHHPEHSTAEPAVDPALEAEIARARAAERISTTARVERGHGRMWAALGSACPVAHETRADAGYTALALQQAAQSGPPGTLEAYRGFGGPALVGNVPALGDVAATDLADALALGLLRALGQQFDASGRARSPNLGAQSALVDFAAELATSGRPSRLLGRGTGEALSRATPMAVQKSLLSFLHSPLSFTVLANQDEEQARAVRRRLELLLAPFLSDGESCPAVRPASIPGSYVLFVDEPGIDVVLVFPVPVAQLGAARAVAQLLDREGGLLEQVLITPRLALGARASATGSLGGEAALIVALDAEPDAVEPATQQLRALMQRIAGGAIVESQHRLLRETWPKSSTGSPVERLFPVFHPLPSLQELRRFAHSYLTEEKLVVVYGKRRD
jgi:hypothetical protein